MTNRAAAAKDAREFADARDDAVKHAREAAESAGEAVEHLVDRAGTRTRETIDGVKERGTEAIDTATTYGRDATAASRRFVRRRPLTAVGAAALAGAALALFLRR